MPRQVYLTDMLLNREDAGMYPIWQQNVIRVLFTAASLIRFPQQHVIFGPFSLRPAPSRPSLLWEVC